jgi:hypothetical protein
MRTLPSVRSRHAAASALAAAALCWAAPRPASAQPPAAVAASATLHGRITAADGAPLEGVAVIVRPADTARRPAARRAAP